MHIVAMGVVHYDTDAEAFGFQQEQGFEICETTGDNTCLLGLDLVSPPEDIVVIVSQVGGAGDDNHPFRVGNAYPIEINSGDTTPNDFEIVVYHF